MRQILETMIDAALGAGRILKKARVDGPAWVREKGANDYVTAADKACEELILQKLSLSYPHIPMLAEEGSGGASGEEGLFWCVDPLDGTNNFVHGVPVYCVSIGLIHDGRPHLGVVYDPVHDEIFTGGEGLEAKLNTKVVRTSGRTALDGAFVATGFPFKEMEHLEAYIAGFRRIAAATAGVRRCGAAAIDLCWTACGRFDGFWERGLWPWDTAAGAAILRSAGGELVDFSGGDDFLFGRTVVAGATREFCENLRRLIG